MSGIPSPPAHARHPLSKAGYLIAGTCAALSLFGIMMLMLIDVAGRYLMNSPVPGAAEVIELLMGVTVFAALPLVTAGNEHIRLDYLSQAVRGRAQALTNAIVTTISAGGMGLLAWRITDTALNIARYGDTTPFLRIPITPVAFFIAACAAISALIFVLQALRFWQQTVVGAPVVEQERQAS